MELVNLLEKNPHVKALLETHDAIVDLRDSATSSASAPPLIPFLKMPVDGRADTIRVVGLRRQPDEPLVSI